MNKQVALLPALCLLASACASDGPPRPARGCPQVAILRPLERIEDYGNDTPDPSTLVAVAVMKSIEGSCDYSDKGVDVTFALTIQAERGPRLGSGHISFPYSISLIDPEDKIRTKEMLTADLAFGAENKQTESKQALHVFLPLAKDQDASSYRVLTGFQLTESQLKSLQKE